MAENSTGTELSWRDIAADEHPRREELIRTVENRITNMMSKGYTGLIGRLLSVGVVDVINPEEWAKTTGQPPETATLYVKVRGIGVYELRINPDYFLNLDSVNGQIFALGHEALHLLFGHLHRNHELRGEQLWTVATEALNNWVMMRMMRVDNMPIEGLVDPKQVYESYKRAAKKQGLEPVTLEQFYQTDIDCYHYLKRVNPPLRNISTCVAWGDGSGGGESPDGTPGMGEMDPEALEDIVGSALEDAIRRATSGGDAKMKETLLDLADRTESSKVWGDVGLGALRAETEVGKAHPIWETLLKRTIASKVTDDGDRMNYNRKTGWWPTDDPKVNRPLSPIGKTEKKQVVVAIDTSGSMPSALIDRIAKLIGEIPNTEAHWLAFDAEVYPFSPGDPLPGGGGTSFEVIAEYIYGQGRYQGGSDNKRAHVPIDFEPDAVVVLTDGYAQPIDPPHREKWIWAITKGGNTWPLDRGMTCVTEIDVEFD